MADRPHHSHEQRQEIDVAILTVSDTRTEADDASGALAAKLIAEAGHKVAVYTIRKDDPDDVARTIRAIAARKEVRAIVLNGGTGISPRDRTFEAIAALLERRLDGFGELFRMLSYQEIGSRAMLSRALAGTLGGVVIFSLPGSPAAVRLGLEKLILPELSHIVAELDKHPASN